MNDQSQPKLDVYSIVNDRILAQLEKGYLPWRQTWTKAGPPRNLISGHPYRGFNILLLASLCYPLNYFLTLKQINELGGRVKKGEHACPVIFWSRKEEETENEEEKKERIILRYYSVFNVEQCVGIPEEKIPLPETQKNDPLKECENLIQGMPQPPKLIHRGDQAYYDSSKDQITMPKIKFFEDSESYYSTLFHEIVHSTGHSSRLARPGITKGDGYDMDKYSEEELIAQIGACFLATLTGIAQKHFENDVAYIGGWLKRLKDDKRLLVFASSRAQYAVDFILGENTGHPEEHENTQAVAE